MVTQLTSVVTGSISILLYKTMLVQRTVTAMYVGYCIVGICGALITQFRTQFNKQFHLWCCAQTNNNSTAYLSQQYSDAALDELTTQRRRRTGYPNLTSLSYSYMNLYQGRRQEIF